MERNILQISLKNIRFFSPSEDFVKFWCIRTIISGQQQQFSDSKKLENVSLSDFEIFYLMANTDSIESQNKI